MAEESTANAPPQAEINAPAPAPAATNANDPTEPTRISSINQEVDRLWDLIKVKFRSFRANLEDRLLYPIARNMPNPTLGYLMQERPEYYDSCLSPIIHLFKPIQQLDNSLREMENNGLSRTQNYDRTRYELVILLHNMLNTIQINQSYFFNSCAGFEANQKWGGALIRIYNLLTDKRTNTREPIDYQRFMDLLTTFSSTIQDRDQLIAAAPAPNASAGGAAAAPATGGSRARKTRRNRRAKRTYRNRRAKKTTRRR